MQAEPMNTLYLSMPEGVERVKGIEPSQPAWKAGALPLSYTRLRQSTSAGTPAKQAGSIIDDKR